MKKLGKITSFTLIIILIASLTVNFPYDATAQEFLFKFPSGLILTEVNDVAVDSSGDIFAVVAHNVIKFSPDGTVLLEFGSFGSGDGQFNRPEGIALDNAMPPNIYVADTSNHRVQIFNSAGNFIKMFGWGVITSFNAFEICTSGCQAGISGSGDGQFSVPRDIALDSSDNIYVADTSNHRVQIFDSAGAFQSKFGLSGPAEGQFDRPRGIALDNAMPPNIYVVDTNNDRVQIFDSSGNFVSMFGFDVDTAGGTGFEICTSSCKAGTSGSGDGQFNRPEGIALDNAMPPNIYVADTNKGRVQIFDSAGAFQSKLGLSGTGDGQFNFPRGITLDSSGNIYVADTNNDRVQIFDSAGAFQSKFGLSGSGDGQFSGPFGITLDSFGNILVVDTFNHRVQIFDSAGVFQSKFGSFGSGDGQFFLHQGVAVDTSGNIYVADTNNDRVQIFDSSGNFVSMFGFDVDTAGGTGFEICTSSCKAGISGSGDGQFNIPRGIALDNAMPPNIYVADTNNDRVQIFDSAGAFQSKFGLSGSGDGQFDRPEGITLDSSGNIYVVDTNNDRVQIFDFAGAFQSKFGLSGSGDGQLNSPQGIALDISGNIYVTDAVNHRVQIFNSAGVLQSTFGLPGTGDGQFNIPRGIVLDSSGNIYVTDAINNRIQIFVNTPCQVPTMPVDMIISSDCFLSISDVAPANVIVESGKIMIIPSDITLDINFASFNLTVQLGGGVLIKAGGAIT